MITTHNLGFPRIGANRELKFALERYWRNEDDLHTLNTTASALRSHHWQQQSDCDWIPVGDFSLYDQVLDASFLLGNVPQRISNQGGSPIDQYFRLARGRAASDDEATTSVAGEMTKWFDTNYHYIVPEFCTDTSFSLHSETLLAQVQEAQQHGSPKVVILGPLSYLWLGKSKDSSDRLHLLDRLLPVYQQLLDELQTQGVEWVQMDEPVLAYDLPAAWQRGFEQAYHQLNRSTLKLLLTTYFGELQDNLRLACQLPVDGLHLDVTRARAEVDRVIDWLPSTRILSLGIIDGRNIWKTDLNSTLDWLEPIADKLGDRLWLAPSCSLLHVPVDLNSETALDEELRSWLAFAVQKLDELSVLKQALNHGRDAVSQELAANQQAIHSRTQSSRVNNPKVKAAVAAITPDMANRQQAFAERIVEQQNILKLPSFPTTTIGSFPQTQEIRQTRRDFKQGNISKDQYDSIMKQAIKESVDHQHDLGIDVLVHGEAERNDMVEYFGEQLDGYAFSQFGWVQSYGSRCVKPPILFGDIQRQHPMTVNWTQYAQSLTDKPMKGMLTGPVTILNWSFVRDDQPRSETCRQLALAIREEVLDLEQAGVGIIQIDEAALREGLPLRQAEWQSYLSWAVECFRISANGVKNNTQIHTHMCYSEFNDIIEDIAAMDADVITIETSRSDMELLDAFNDFAYPNDIGPGVYDIHSPNTPSVEAIEKLMRKAAQKIPAERLWINPDCGLKTRRWTEVLPALSNMVSAAQRLREPPA